MENAVELDEYKQMTGQYFRRKSKMLTAEFEDFKRLLDGKFVEQQTEGQLEAFGDGDECSEAYVYLNSVYFPAAAFPIAEDHLKALTHLKKKAKLTVKLEILD